MPSIIKVDQIQSDTGTTQISSSNVVLNKVVTGTTDNTIRNRYIGTQGGLYARSVTSNVIAGAVENNASAHFGKADDVGDVSVFIGADQGSGSVIGQKCGYIGSVNAGTSYVPLVLQPSGSGSVILQSGQLKFPASQNASSDPNTLDDYEEGLWTPTIGGGYTTSRNISAGTYVKIGSLVYLHCQLDLTTSNSGSGAFFISGIPFTSFNTNSHGQALALGALFNWNVGNSSYQIGARINDSTTSIYFWNNIDASSDDLLSTPFANGATVYGSISGCYRVA
jgi:hypothetical protein